MFDVCAGVRLLGSGSALPLVFETVRGSFVVLLALSLRLAPPELTRFTCRIGGFHFLGPPSSHARRMLLDC